MIICRPKEEGAKPIGEGRKKVLIAGGVDVVALILFIATRSGVRDYAVKYAGHDVSAAGGGGNT